ncbi:tetratricopeptide repeat protein [Telmatospirillum sp. J64-1]|uniref:tetratricopeptide repeat protein n=1 Tax=Telmatospirillum sp. J64-1 TaxID=2502183 RepID=UPI00115DFD02|nr:tetratricopeptide repeat protein [Telmatospirillum sp. J64-1]
MFLLFAPPAWGDEDAQAQVFAEARELYSNLHYEQALQLLWPLAEAGYPPAQQLIGYTYIFGNGNVPSDQCLAVEWMEKAARAGDARAQWYIASFYKIGAPVWPDKGLHYLWLLESAKNGYEESIRTLDQAAAQLPEFQRKKMEEYAKSWNPQTDSPITILRMPYIPVISHIFFVFTGAVPCSGL